MGKYVIYNKKRLKSHFEIKGGHGECCFKNVKTGRKSTFFAVIEANLR